MRKAIVVGSSMSGLMAARALADFFDDVTVLDRDDLPEGPELRKSVPQARHIHLLLMKGGQVIESFFPGITRTLVEDGVPVLDAGLDFLTISSFGPVARSKSGIELLLCSRSLLEWRVRERLRALPNVRIVPRTEVTDLIASEDNHRIQGVRIRSRHDSGPATELRADLVVDVSGRDSKTPRWLTQLGYPPPAVSEVNSFLGYATRWYRREGLDINGYKAVLMNSRAPNNPRFGGILPAEDGRWVCTLAGFSRNYPPIDDEGFLDFARQLPDPIIYEFLRKAEPLSPIAGYRKTQNVLRHYEKLSRWPRGFIAMGDAVCAFNPIYAQGMAVGALGAQALHEQLKENQVHQEGFGLAFQKRLARVTATPWAMATAEDFRWPATVGARPGLGWRIGHWYGDRILKAAVGDAALCRAFLEVVHLLKPRESLLRPRSLLRALTA